MLGTLFDKVTGLFDKRFTLALLLPTFALAVGTGALATTMTGWHRTVAPVVVVLAVITGADQQFQGPIVLVWDNLSTHLSRAMRQLIEARVGDGVPAPGPRARAEPRSRACGWPAAIWR